MTSGTPLPADELNPNLPIPSHKVVDVGRYRLIAELARGGMGIVYLALVRGPGGFNKLFVVKVLKEHMSEDPKLVFMFLEEARLAAKLNHPNVVQTIEVGSDRGQHFIAMEYLDGQSLHRIVARGRRTAVVFPQHFQLYVLMELLEGLQYAHGVTDFDGTPMRLVHRDVSPQNVLVTYDGLVKILDFGIAKALDSSNDTRTGMLKGKVAYMAPEQASGEPLDGRADVFAVGAMLWEAAVGDRMWSRTSNDLQILHALMNGTIPRPRDANPNIDPRLERMILKATSYRPADRHAS
ncbi:MAG: serine/threonine-protein kinase, partial [Polyangiaceae bacterium]